MTAPLLTLYVDGRCPLCVAEVTRLQAWDGHRRLAFIDIAQTGFDPSPLGVSLAALNHQLHGWTDNGRCLIGIDCMIAAYTMVDKGWMVYPLRIPAFRPAFRVLYRSFARNRIRISRLMGLKTPLSCTEEACAIKDYPYR